MRLDDTVYVERIAYDAKGQRALIAYGNGVMTRYAYDPQHVPAGPAAQRALHLDDGPTYRPAGAALQDFGYDYDLAGNILAIRDRTPGSGIPNNPERLRRDRPAVARRCSAAATPSTGTSPTTRSTGCSRATGREYDAHPAGDPWIDHPARHRPHPHPRLHRDLPLRRRRQPARTRPRTADRRLHPRLHRRAPAATGCSG